MDIPNLKFFLLFSLIFALAHFSKAQDEPSVDLSKKQNENEYYNESIFDELADDDPTITEEDNTNQAETAEEGDDSDEAEEEEDKNIMKEWEEYMYDFVPADMLTYEIQKDQKEYFFEDIMEIPSYVRGAYFVSSDEKGKIDFYVLDPKNKTIQVRLDKREGLFYFNATKKGVYSFIFWSNKGTEKKQITFAIHCGNSTEQLLKNEHLSPLQTRIYSIEAKINDLTLETKFSNKRQDSHYKSLKNANHKILMFSLFETAAIFIAVFWQVYYIEKLLDNRRIV